VKFPFQRATMTAILCACSYVAQGQTAGNSAATSDAPTIQRMDHVGINVTDLQRSADWYGKAPWIHSLP
jgi:hypothetical protein